MGRSRGLPKESHQKQNRQVAPPNEANLAAVSNGQVELACKPDPASGPPAGPVLQMSAEVYSRERTLLLDLDRANTEQHDKAILQLAAGALALTVTFMEKIAPHPDPSTLTLLAAGWVVLVVCIGAMVGSFWTGQKACRAQLALLNEEYADGMREKRVNRWAKWTARLNGGSFVLFVVGVALILVFSWSNLRSNSNNAPAPADEPTTTAQPREGIANG